MNVFHLINSFRRLQEERRAWPAVACVFVFCLARCPAATPGEALSPHDKGMGYVFHRWPSLEVVQPTNCPPFVRALLAASAEESSSIDVVDMAIGDIIQMLDASVHGSDEKDRSLHGLGNAISMSVSNEPFLTIAFRAAQRGDALVGITQGGHLTVGSRRNGGYTFPYEREPWLVLLPGPTSIGSVAAPMPRDQTSEKRTGTWEFVSEDGKPVRRGSYARKEGFEASFRAELGTNATGRLTVWDCWGEKAQMISLRNGCRDGLQMKWRDRHCTQYYCEAGLLEGIYTEWIDTVPPLKCVEAYYSKGMREGVYTFWPCPTKTNDYVVVLFEKGWPGGITRYQDGIAVQTGDTIWDVDPFGKSKSGSDAR